MSHISYESMREALSGERVLLVGGAGFIGHNLALELAGLGVEVCVADNLMVNNIVANVSRDDGGGPQREIYLGFLLERFDMMREAGVRLVNVDARMSGDLRNVFLEFEPSKVVHLSAIASAVEARKDPGKCFDLQLVTLRNTLELCRTGDGKPIDITFMSSSTVYGDFEGDSVDETTRPQPNGIYANAKYMGERLMRTYADQYGIASTIIRPSALYGERCISRRVSQVFIENALSGKPLLLEGGGDGRLDFTYIQDLVQGIVRAMAVNKDEGYTNTFNITFGNARTIADLASVVQQVVPDLVLEERPRANDKPIRGTLSTDRAQQILGFEPQWTLENGYRQFCEWYADRWNRSGKAG